MKLAFTPGVPLADCATSRYSTGLVVEALPEKTTQPAAGIGSTEAHSPTPRVIAWPRLTVQAGSGGRIATSLLQAAARSSHGRPIRLSLRRNMFSLRHF